ncbi:MAG: amidohydrolase family protein [Deltaproteobacteria bacterium]|nr:amidohydrolase family protein [Deltaproteobacteria bacterium]
MPYRSAVEAGIRVALSSDNPCTTEPSPLLALWESVHRRTRPIGSGKGKGIPSYVYNHPDKNGVVYDERVDINQAIRGHTIDAAYAGFEDDRKGSIEGGKLADLVIWDADIRRAGDRIRVTEAVKFKPVMTIIDGKIVYQDRSSVRVRKV